MSPVVSTSADHHSHGSLQSHGSQLHSLKYMALEILRARRPLYPSVSINFTIAFMLIFHLVGYDVGLCTNKGLFKYDVSVFWAFWSPNFKNNNISFWYRFMKV